MQNKMVSKITNVEIPVSNLERSVKWYTELLGLHIQYQDNDSAMLSFYVPGAASIFLMKTDDPSRLSFRNTTWNIDENSVIDFYAEDLNACHEWLREQGANVTPLNSNEDGPLGFGLQDPDGNVLGVCNVDHDLIITH
ncbi:VOC family protein [Virgibacillus doumboii]|uniref:VOC family protein n=1 Tax=Virgibacillus doumboii TaxID=2697503 RepID=UPI001FEB3862|nr:VOC family protein [Virgibacillus doumboii]